MRALKYSDEQLEALADLESHPGWQLVAERIRAEVRGHLEGLAGADPANVVKMARKQGAILALRSILETVETAQVKLAQKGV